MSEPCGARQSIAVISFCHLCETHRKCGGSGYVDLLISRKLRMAVGDYLVPQTERRVFFLDEVISDTIVGYVRISV